MTNRIVGQSAARTAHSRPPLFHFQIVARCKLGAYREKGGTDPPPGGLEIPGGSGGPACALALSSLSESSFAAREGQESPGSRRRSGAARARKLSSEERSAIAKKGARARQAIADSQDLPRATHAGEKEVGGYTVPVCNLSDGRRVISERGFLGIIGARGRGKTGGHQLARILADPIINALFPQHVLVAISNPVKFLSLTNTLTYGYEDVILNDFCIAFSKAKNSKALKTEVQYRYAEYCETLLYAFARIGVSAWIDEATGFQRDRARDALHKILEKYISDRWATWSKTFPDEFYENIYRLRGLKYDPEQVNRPGFIGRLTNNIVYARLAPGVLDELQRKNPVIDEVRRRQRKHHQWLTRDFGHPKLKEHITSLIFMMRGATKWDSFYRGLQRAAPRLHETAEFDFGDES